MKKKSGAQIFERLTSLYIGLMMTVFLFCMGRMGYMGIADAKFSAFLQLSGGYIVIAILLYISMRLTGQMERPSLKVLIEKSTWPQRFALLYLGLTWLSALCSPYFPHTLMGVSRHEGAWTITLYVAVFLLISVYGRVEKWMVPTFGGAAVLFCVICILQLMGGDPLHLYPAGYTYFDANIAYFGAYLGTIGNVDLVAAFLCMAIPILAVPLWRSSDRRKWLLLLPLGLCLFVLLKMWVMAGLVGVLLGGAASFCVTAPVSAKGRKIVAGGLAVVCILGLGLLYAADVGSGLLHEVHLLLHGQIDDSFGSGRIYIWRNVLARLPGQLLRGSGPDTMALAQIPPFTRYDPSLGGTVTTHIDAAHNIYLNILFHQGLPALLTCLALLGSLLLRWCKGSTPAAAALGSAVLCYAVQGCFGIDMVMTAGFFWLILGLLAAETNRAGS